MNETSQKIAEVIETSTAQYIAQCYELYPSQEGPNLGSLVRTGDIYGIVAGAGTTSLEPGRRPIARGRDEATEEAVYESSPQLAKLLRSEITVVVAGHRNGAAVPGGSSIRQYLPPQPARIHGFVYLCQPDEVKEFGKSFGFLTMLLNADVDVPGEELVAATLRNLAPAQDDPRAFLVASGRELAALLSSDFIRLKTILARLTM